MIKIKWVNKDHIICSNVCPKELDQRMKKFWKSRRLSWTKADGAVIITDDNKIIGFIRYMTGQYNCYYSFLALGTYILPKYRKMKLASKLWTTALNKVKPAFVVVSLTSPISINLIESLKKKHKGIKFYTLKEF